MVWTEVARIHVALAHGLLSDGLDVRDDIDRSVLTGVVADRVQRCSISGDKGALIDGIATVVERRSQETPDVVQIVSTTCDHDRLVLEAIKELGMIRNISDVGAAHRTVGVVVEWLRQTSVFGELVCQYGPSISNETWSSAVGGAEDRYKLCFIGSDCIVADGCSCGERRDCEREAQEIEKHLEGIARLVVDNKCADSKVIL